MAFDDETGETREEKNKTALYFTKPDFPKTWESEKWCRKTLSDNKKALGFVIFGNINILFVIM